MQSNVNLLVFFIVSSYCSACAINLELSSKILINLHRTFSVGMMNTAASFQMINAAGFLGICDKQNNVMPPILHSVTT